MVSEASHLKRRTIDFLAESQALCPSQLVPRFPTLFACPQHLKVISVAIKNRITCWSDL